jgi:hypothetical protein
VGIDQLTYRANDGLADSQLATVSITVAPAATAGWVFDVGGRGDDFSTGMATDAQGNLYLAGGFSATVDFDPGPRSVELTSAGQTDTFVAKYSSDGSLQWVRQADGLATVSIAVDSIGGVYISGWFEATARIGSDVLISTGEADAFAAKYSTDGAFLWVTQFATGGEADAVSYAIAVDAAGDLYVTGPFDVSAQFGSDVLTSAGDYDLFVAKLRGTDGQPLWARAAGGSGNDVSFGITVDVDGNPAVTGRFGLQADFGPYTLTKEWGFGSFVTKLNASDGQFLWALGLGMGVDSGAEGYTLAPDGQGNLYAAGVFWGSGQFGPQWLSAAGDYADIYLAKIDAGGNVLWARRFGGSEREVPWGMAVDAQGNPYLTGWFLGAADFDPGPGVVPLAARGVEDAFAVKLDTAGQLVRAWRMGGPDSITEGYAVSVLGPEIYVFGDVGGRGTVDFPGGNLIGVQGDDWDAFLYHLVPEPLPEGPPIANDDSYKVDAFGTLEVASPGVLGNDSDPDAQPLFAGNLSEPDHGSLSFNPDGSFTYAPEPGYVGTDSFSYRASAGLDESNEATVAITVESFLAIEDIWAVEGDTGTTDAVFALTSSYAGWEIVLVDYATSNGTATAWSDYQPTSGRLTIDSSQSEYTIRVPVFGDTLDEPDETFFLDLSDPFGISFGRGQATIVDDAFFIGDAALTEGDSGTTSLVLTVSLSADTDGPISVDYATADGTANAGSDYTAIPTTTLYFTASQTSQTIAVEVHGDTQSEPNETFLVNLSNPSNGAIIVDSQGVGTILDDDPWFGPPQVLNTTAYSDSGPDGWPQLATDGLGNWVAVWNSTNNLGGTIGTDLDIFVSRSTDAGATWTYPAILNTNAASDSEWDNDPQVTTDGAGNWVAVWLSTDDLGGTIGTDRDILFATFSETLRGSVKSNAHTLTGWSPTINDSAHTAAAVDMALLAWIDLDSSDDKDTKPLAAQVADELALMMME